MEECKAERIRAYLLRRQETRFIAMKEIVKLFKRSCHPNDFIPKPEEIFSLPDVKGILVDGTDEEFDTFKDGLASQLPELRNRYLEKQYRRLQGKIPRRIAGSSDNAAETSARSESHDFVPSHQLATSWYTCKKYGSCGVFNSRDILVHSDLRPSDARFTSNGVDIRDYFDEYLNYAPKASAMAKKMIIACGKDPKVTTIDEMDKLQARFVSLYRYQAKVVTWWRLVSYCLHVSFEPCSIVMYSSDRNDVSIRGHGQGRKLETVERQ
jgi:hypothetical protein